MFSASKRISKEKYWNARKNYCLLTIKCSTLWGIKNVLVSYGIKKFYHNSHKGVNDETWWKLFYVVLLKLSRSKFSQEKTFVTFLWSTIRVVNNFFHSSAPFERYLVALLSDSCYSLWLTEYSLPSIFVSLVRRNMEWYMTNG